MALAKSCIAWNNFFQHKFNTVYISKNIHTVLMANESGLTVGLLIVLLHLFVRGYYFTSEVSSYNLAGLETDEDTKEPIIEV